MPPLYQRRHFHFDGASEAALDAQHVVVVGVDPDASPRCNVSHPVEAVVESVRGLDELGSAPAIHGREIDQQGSAVSLSSNTGEPELVFRTLIRQEERQWLGRDRTWVGTSRTVLFV